MPKTKIAGNAGPLWYRKICEFSNQFRPFVLGLLSADYDSSLDDSGLPPEVKRAVIVYNGQLTGDYEYLHRYLNP